MINIYFFTSSWLNHRSNNSLFTNYCLTEYLHVILANAAAEEENADESQKDYGEEDLETVDDSLRDNNRDDTVQKIPARHLPEPEVEIQHNQPYDNSEESPRKKEVVADPFLDETDSNFFTYFIFIMFACIICYVVSAFIHKILTSKFLFSKFMFRCITIKVRFSRSCWKDEEAVRAVEVADESTQRRIESWTVI